MSTVKTHLPHPNYRPDIDGLRAIAILSVVVFHACRDCMPGGFIGVDIFFVISGFLISSILLSGLEKNQFSIKEFYVKRIRRIFPALIVVMSASIFLAWYLLFSDEFQRFGKHLTAGITFLSNIVFWRESGYFDSASETKPLLHFWSLAIEEQFYLFWPLLLAFLWKKKLGFTLPILSIAIISFVFNIIIIKNHPVASFFLPLTRVWELVLGGLLAYIFLHRPKVINQYQNLQSIIGFFLLVIGFIFINESSRFPGWWALLPTLGTFFIISAGSDAWLNNQLLSNKLMIWVGNISYPMYLWHWPLLSFAYIMTNGQVSKMQLASILILTVFLSWVTYRFIENPIRFGKLRVRAIPVMIVMMIVLLVMALFVQFGKIAPRNNSDELQTFIEARNDTVNLQNDFIKVSFNQEKFYYAASGNLNKTVLIGDSHALQYVPRVSHLLKENPNKLNTIYLAIHEGCLPVPELQKDENDINERKCNDYRKSLLELLHDPKIKTIVLTGCWNCYLIQDKSSSNKHMESNKYAQQPLKNEILENLKHFLAKEGKSKEVYLVLDNPIGGAFDPSNYLKGNRVFGFNVIDMPKFSEFDKSQQQLRQKLLSIAKEANVNVIDPVDYLCKDELCQNLDADSQPIYKDNNHLRSGFVSKNAEYIDQAFLK